MSTDFERRLRETLHSAATEVQTSPETWTRVAAGIRRQRVLRGVSMALGAAAAVVVAVAILPGLVQGSRVGLDPGPAAPAPVPTGPAAPAPAGMASTDGSRISVQMGPDGTDVLEVPDASLSALAVWPRSTARAFQVVAVDEQECRLHVYRSGGEPGTPLAARVCGPVAFSPDGRHLAWIEDGADGPVLQTIGWDARGPRPQDDAAFGLETDVADLQLQDWVWTSVSGEEAAGYLVIGGSGRRYEAHRLPVMRQGDGALALRADTQLEPVTADAAEGGIVAAEAHGGTVRYQLRVDDGEGGPQLVRLAVGSEEVAPMQVDVPQWGSGDPASLWLAASGDQVLYGDGDQAFSGRLIDGEWTVGALPGVRAADFLPRLPRGSAPAQQDTRAAGG